jgi:hypothetical protein
MGLRGQGIFYAAKNKKILFLARLFNFAGARLSGLLRAAPFPRARNSFYSIKTLAVLACLLASPARRRGVCFMRCVPCQRETNFNPPQSMSCFSRPRSQNAPPLGKAAPRLENSGRARGVRAGRPRFSRRRRQKASSTAAPPAPPWRPPAPLEKGPPSGPRAQAAPPKRGGSPPAGGPKLNAWLLWGLGLKWARKSAKAEKQKTGAPGAFSPPPSGERGRGKINTQIATLIAARICANSKPNFRSAHAADI